MDLIKCNDCGKFIGKNDLLNKNVDEKRKYDWDGLPLKDVIFHINCEKAGGK